MTRLDTDLDTILSALERDDRNVRHNHNRPVSERRPTMGQREYTRLCMEAEYLRRILNR